MTAPLSSSKMDTPTYAVCSTSEAIILTLQMLSPATHSLSATQSSVASPAFSAIDARIMAISCPRSIDYQPQHLK
ncbi:hypothetical protein [Rubritalea tangerina]|uniref:hypothetical protein n=1 Tax=Rubritalea tangerina TaxID=430798 RepID=UPI00361BF8D6